MDPHSGVCLPLCCVGSEIDTLELWANVEVSLTQSPLQSTGERWLTLCACLCVFTCSAVVSVSMCFTVTGVPPWRQH